MVNGKWLVSWELEHGAWGMGAFGMGHGVLDLLGVGHEFGFPGRVRWTPE
jgi:hypothetical protein